MADERVVTPVLHIEGCGNKVVDHVSFAGGRDMLDWAAEQGITFRTEYRRESWTQAELRRGDLESEVAKLREEFPDGDYPVAAHPPDEPCAHCEAIRFLEERG